MLCVGEWGFFVLKKLMKSVCDKMRSIFCDFSSVQFVVFCSFLGFPCIAFRMVFIRL